MVDTLDGGTHASLHQMRGIQNYDAKKLALGGLAVREPETRHAWRLGQARERIEKEKPRRSLDCSGVPRRGSGGWGAWASPSLDSTGAAFLGSLFR
jgi:queuine/archaeosine tRNA-ribosyltransferase